MLERGCDWLLVDGSSLIFRAFFGRPKSIRAPDGRLVNAVSGTLDTLSRVIAARRPARLAMADDEDWRPRWRVEYISTYKARRVAEPVPPELIPQLPLVRRALDAVGVEFVGVAELEAEDVIASWVSQINGRVEILSGDRDLFALVRDPDVTVLYPEKGRLVTIDEAEITRRYDIPGRLYGEYAVLRGDPSDGLPGLPKVGPATAAALIRKHGGLDGLLREGGLSDEAASYIERARLVVTPGSDHPVPLPEGRRSSYPTQPETVADVGAELGVTPDLNRLVKQLAVRS